MIYLNIKWKRDSNGDVGIQKEKKIKLSCQEDLHTPNKLAIGVDGGFALADNGDKIIKEYGLVWFHDLSNIIPYPFADEAYPRLPESMIERINYVINSNDASLDAAVQTWDATNEALPVSKFAANLEQLDNGVRISSDPNTWACSESGMTDNLWLNLSTGYIGSGRRNWDGSGGTGAALAHFEATGRKVSIIPYH